MAIRAFAHRGGAHHPDLIGHENTLRAFQHAVSLGYRDLETDVHLTADGRLIAFHDAVLDRVTDAVGVIAQLPYAEIAQARIGGTEPVPLLDDLLDALPDGVRFNIDLKAPGTAAALAALVQRRGLGSRLTVGSFSGRELGRFRSLTAGAVPTSAHPAEIVAYLASPLSRPLRALRGPMALQIPHRQRGVVVANPGLIRRAHANCLQVHVWTIDDPDEMAVLLDRGVDGLMTDRTDILKDVLIHRGQWEGS
ncbi:glycerophosphodiester phosphodiesterase family protein [Nocardioides sp.]|uniref:glycerophosphodiester phosphodiesterase family protein n=1 Tax=Nocardioides sp. TaxID=35761 RepID=UPI00261304E1|nr:glycerophosphodiester phosphodiesterase family protein [Nocardioides sp.]